MNGDQITAENAGRTALQAIPRPARLGVYLGYAVLGPVLGYLQSKGMVGPDEWVLYVGLGSIFGVTAAGNVTIN